MVKISDTREPSPPSPHWSPHLCDAIQRVHNLLLDKDFMLREFQSQLILSISTRLQHLPLKNKMPRQHMYIHYIWPPKPTLSQLRTPHDGNTLGHYTIEA